jgi:hypothetical protein
MENNLKKIGDNLDFLENRRRSEYFEDGRQQKCKFNQQHIAAKRSAAQHSPAQCSTAQYRQPDQRNNQNILVQMKKSTLIGCGIIVN